MHPASPPGIRGLHSALRARTRNSGLSASLWSCCRRCCCCSCCCCMAASCICPEAPPTNIPRPASRPAVSSSTPIHSFDSSVTRSRNNKRRRLLANATNMASATATATATMAAAGFDKRASTASSSLQTPGSGTFPSELLSPMAASSPSFSKREDALKTPITPPSAYLDFLKNFSPAIQSPASTGTSARFSFHENHSFDKSSDKASEISGPKSSSISPPTSQPPLSRNTSYDSNKSTATERSDASTESIERSKPQSPRIIIPPTSQFAKPAAPRSARGTPRRLHIPQSPAFSPALGSALSTCSVPSPYSSTPISAAPWSASFSPRDYTVAEANANGPPGKVHVRQVVTRTVTYCRTPLDPAPKGKRRKIEVEEADEVSTNDSKSEMSSDDSASDQPIKREKAEEVDATPTEAMREGA